MNNRRLYLGWAILLAGCGDASTSASRDTDSADIEPEEIAIQIVNRFDTPRYIQWGITMAERFYGARALRCEFLPEGENAEEACLLDRPGCEHFCSELSKGDECFYECEPDFVVKQILPGETVQIPWAADVVVAAPDFCAKDSGVCYQVEPAAKGRYRFTVTAYEDTNCGTPPCNPDDQGRLVAEPVGASSEYSAEYIHPDADAAVEIVLE